LIYLVWLAFGDWDIHVQYSEISAGLGIIKMIKNISLIIHKTSVHESFNCFFRLEMLFAGGPW
jgi:hypothetical protein